MPGRPHFPPAGGKPIPVQQLLREALQWHRNGDLTKAAACYDQRLRSQPRHVDALQMRSRRGHGIAPRFVTELEPGYGVMRCRERPMPHPALNFISAARGVVTIDNSTAIGKGPIAKGRS